MSSRREYNPYRNIQGGSNGIFNTEQEMLQELHRPQLPELHQQLSVRNFNRNTMSLTRE